MLFAAYAATLRVDAAGGSHYAGDEPHLLLAAESLARRTGTSTSRTSTRSGGAAPRPTAAIVAGRLVEPHGLGFPLLLAPAYALGGATLVELALAAVAALAFVLGAALARRVVPDPWATWAALLAGLSPPALAHATAVLPGADGRRAARRRGAVRARRARAPADAQRVRRRGACSPCCPWLDPWLLVPALPVALLLARWTARRGRGLVALGTVELQLASLVFYVSLNERLYGGFTPLAASDGPLTGATSAGDYAGAAAARSPSSGSIATSGCCAGRPCWRWRSSAPGCSGARGASGSRG